MTSEAEETKPTLPEKMLNVVAGCLGLKEDARNSHHGYSYISWKGISGAVAPLLVKNRVYTTTQVSHTERPNGNVMVQARVFHWDVDDASAKPIVYEGVGEGKDPGDKATMKAQTAAFKNAYVKGLGIGSGEDPEADAETDRRASKKPVAKKQTLDNMKGGF